MKPSGPFLEVVSGAGEPDAEIEQVLGAARRWVEPSRENRERVSAGLRGALPALSGSSGVPRALWPGDVEPTNVHQAKAGRASRLGRLPWLLVGGALIGALGFWLGHGVGFGAAERVAAARAGSEPAGAHAQPVLDELAVPHVPPVLDPSSMLAAPTSTPPTAAPSASTPSVSSLPARAAVPAPARSRRSPPRSTRAARAATNAEPSRMSFRQVLDQLRRAQQQLRSGQATMSLLLLTELDRNAGDVLLEERNATRVLALCGAGQDEAARDVARRLENDSPRSIYGMRLESSCITDPALVDGSAREVRSE